MWCTIKIYVKWQNCEPNLFWSCWCFYQRDHKHPGYRRWKMLPCGSCRLYITQHSTLIVCRSTALKASFYLNNFLLMREPNCTTFNYYEILECSMVFSQMVIDSNVFKLFYYILPYNEYINQNTQCHDIMYFILRHRVVFLVCIPIITWYCLEIDKWTIKWLWENKAIKTAIYLHLCILF